MNIQYTIVVVVLRNVCVFLRSASVLLLQQVKSKSCPLASYGCVSCWHSCLALCIWWCFVECVRQRRTHPAVARLGGVKHEGLLFGSPWVLLASCLAVCFWQCFLECVWQRRTHPTLARLGGVKLHGLHFGSLSVLLALMPPPMNLVVFVECVQQRQATPQLHTYLCTG